MSTSSKLKKQRNSSKRKSKIRSSTKNHKFKGNLNSGLVANPRKNLKAASSIGKSELKNMEQLKEILKVHMDRKFGSEHSNFLDMDITSSKFKKGRNNSQSRLFEGKKMSSSLFSNNIKKYVKRPHLSFQNKRKSYH